MPSLKILAGGERIQIKSKPFGNNVHHLFWFGWGWLGVGGG